MCVGSCIALEIWYIRPEHAQMFPLLVSSVCICQFHAWRLAMKSIWVLPCRILDIGRLLFLDQCSGGPSHSVISNWSKRFVFSTSLKVHRSILARLSITHIQNRGHTVPPSIRTIGKYTNRAKKKNIYIYCTASRLLHYRIGPIFHTIEFGNALPISTSRCMLKYIFVQTILLGFIKIRQMSLMLCAMCI